MKPNMQRKGNIAQAPGRHVLGTSQVKKGTNRQSGPGQKASGIGKEAIALEPKSREFDPLTKIKLQLFPVDEVTRIGLEKDGLNPFLELTLRARKKISSVIKHIHEKWGGSSIAVGEPMLLPYDSQLRDSAMSTRWTSKDATISAGDVYTAIESPAIFCLSYGWFSDHEPRRVSAAAAPHKCIKSETMQKQIVATEERRCLDATAQVAVTEHVDTEVKMGHNSHEWSDDMTNLRMGGLNESKSSGSRIDLHPICLSTDISIGGLLSEASLQGKLPNNELVLNGRNTDHHQQAPIQWDDSLTALSIGGLLSEASLQAKILNSDPNCTERRNPSAFISDSLDAAIVSSQAKLNSNSSILDAEETCHAFSFRKLSSSSKNVRVSARATQDCSSNSFRFPHLPQVDKKAVDTRSPEPKTDCPQQYDEDSRSLGIRGITWNESLGPFDLGNPMRWKGSGSRGGNAA